MTTLRGRVRPTFCLKRDGDSAPCVLATSWASDRPFPRTVGVGVAFEIETASGEVFRVDPFEAVVALPVRRREREGGVSREYAWLAPADEVTVTAFGEIDREGAVRAARIALDVAGKTERGLHHVPPRTLRAGEPEEASDGTVVEAPQARPQARGKRRRGAQVQTAPAPAPLPDPLPAERGEGEREGAEEGEKAGEREG